MKHKTFSTVDELAQYVLGRHAWSQDDRFRLIDRYDSEYVDPIAGEAYEQAWLKIRELHPNTYRYSETPAEVRAADQAALDAWEEANPQPTKERVTKLYLEEVNHGRWTRNQNVIHLEGELKQMVYDVWTKRPPYRGASNTAPYGAMTLQGLLKRLGKTDVGDRIKDAQKLKKMQDETNLRNIHRDTIAKSIDATLDSINRYPEVLPHDCAAVIEMLENVKASLTHESQS